MPALPLPLPIPLDGGELPVVSTEDVAAVESFALRAPETAPVRDAIRAGLLAMFGAYQRFSRRAAALSDTLRATGIYLDGLGRDGEVFRQAGEGNEAYRARILTPPELVTPQAILDAAGAVLAPFTSALPQYAESILDTWYVDDGDATWSSHVWDRNDDHPPAYDDRLYEDRAAFNGGYARPQSAPMGPIVFDDSLGREFVLRIPDLAPVDISEAFIWDYAALTDPDLGLFVGDGTETVEFAFTFDSGESEDAIYGAVINAVERIKGHGVRWILYVDPNLS